MGRLIGTLTPEEQEARRARDRARKAAVVRAANPALPPYTPRVPQGPANAPTTPHVPAGHEIAGVSTLVPTGGGQQWTKTRVAGRKPAPIPEGFEPKRISQMVRGDGSESVRWLAWEKGETERVAALLAAIDRHAEKYEGFIPPAPAPEITDAETITVYPIGDHHHGMLAWAPEAGEHWDHKYSEASLRAAVNELVRMAPPSELAIVVNLGDMKHAQDDTQLTPGHGNKLDVDGRAAKLDDLLLEMLTGVTDALLRKHARVRWRHLPGNHDPRVAAALAREMRAWYRNEPRVEIMPAHAAHQYDRFGKVLLGYHHGDRTPSSELAAIMAVDEREAWGECTYCHWLCGHVHHKIRDKEHPGCTVESFNILPPGDAYHAGRYRASRSMQALTMHREYGEISRAIVGYERIRAEVERRAAR